MKKLIIVLSVILLLEIISYFLGIRIAFNISESMPMGIYVMTGKLVKNINRNDVIVFCPHLKDLEIYSQRKYLGESKDHRCFGKYPAFVKRVAAVEGDTVTIKSDKVYINNNELKDSKLFNKDPKGLLLSRLPNGFSKKLDKDEIFAFADGVTNSLDSRYIGIIKKEEILSMAFFIKEFKR